jgi:hypothetical protein
MMVTVSDVPRRRVDKSLLAISLVVAIGVVLVVRGLLVGVTGDDRANLPTLVESVNPVPEAVQALSQTQVFADLAAGHTGVFVIDGIEIDTFDINDPESERASVEPGDQIDIPAVTIYEAGNSTLTYTPSDGAPIEKFESGEHDVRLIYWDVSDGRQRARTFTWTFNVV